MKTSVTKLPYPIATAALTALTLTHPVIVNAQTSLSWLGGNASSSSWGAGSNFNAAFVSSNQTDITFNVMTRATDNAYGANRTVRSISFGSSINGNWTTATTNSTVLTFAANTGNASVNVDSSATGNISFTSLGASVTGSQSLTSNLELNHNGSGLLTFGRQFAGAGGLVKNGSGTVLIAAPNNNSFTGAVTVNTGRLIMGSTASTTGDMNGSSGITLNGGILEIRTTNGLAKSLNPGITVAGNSTLAYNNTTDVTQAFTVGTGALVLNANLTAQNISSNGTLANQFNITRNLTGSGDLIVRTNNNVISGATSLTPARVQLSGNNSAWLGNLIISRGTAQFNGLGSSFAGNITIGTSGDTFGAGLAFNNGNNTVTISNQIFVLTGGARVIRNNAGPNTTGEVFLNGAINLAGNLTLDHGNLGDGKKMTSSGNITGAGGLNISRLGQNLTANTSVVLTGSNSYSGATNVGADATLEINSSSGNGIGDSSDVSLTGANSQLIITTSETIGSLASAGGIGNIVLTGNLTAGGNNLSTTYGGTSSGAGGLTKVGSGTMTLSGTNGYTGATTVSEGTLIVSGSIASSVTTIAPGAVLTFTGSASAGNITIGAGASFALGTGGTAGAVTINGGTFTGAGTVGSLALNGSSVFSPGNSPGTVTIADGGSLTMSSSTISNFEITSSAFTAGTYDLVVGTAGGAAESVTFDGILNLIFSGGGYSVSATAVKLFDVDNYSGSFSAINVSGLDSGLVATLNTSTGYVEIAAIPEPSSIAVLAGFGALGFVAYRRRRQLVKAA